MRRALWFGRAAGGLAVAAVLLIVAAPAPGAGEHAVKEGGTFHVAVATDFFRTIDPALASLVAEHQVLAPACGSLVGYPAKPLPEGGQLRPELAAVEPVISRDGKTYTFTIRKDARFSNGAPVTARAFERTIERFLDPAMNTALASKFAPLIVGGEDVLAGKATTPRGVTATGRTLVLKLTKRSSDFLTQWIAGFCAVPPNLPVDPEGAKAPLPSAAPYYVSEYVPGEQLVLERNEFYKGWRQHHVDRFVVNLGADAGAIIDEIASGRLDWGWTIPALRARAGELRQRYGVNKSRFFVTPTPFLRMFVLNNSRPLFKNNPMLRQAVNLAVNRRALTRELGPLAGTPTDHFLPRTAPGYRNVRIYPLAGPDLRKARELAKGNRRGGKAVLYTRSDPVDVAQAQVLRQNLKAIGLDVEIVQFPGSNLIFEKLATEKNLFDIGRIAFGNPEPSQLLHLFDGRTIGHTGNQNLSYFNSPTVNRLLDEASRLTGPARNRAYGELDVLLARDFAPAIPIAHVNEPTFVSAKVGCIVLRPGLVLTAVCLK